jgi:hypothetical protein
MYRKVLLIALIGLFVLSACANLLPVTGPVSAPTELPEAEEPAGESWQPGPGDDEFQRAEVEISSAEILTLESFPPQFLLHVAGSKGNPCNMLRAAISDPDEQNRIFVDVYTLFDPAALCVQVLEGFDVNLPLGTLKTGEYTVILNGHQVGQLVAP